MRQTYRKSGSVVRWENGTVVCVSETGVAKEEDDRFECHPDPSFRLEAIDPTRVVAAADALRKVIPEGVQLERAVITEGVAEHEIDGFRWRESTERMHVALTRGRVRVLLDLGALDPAEVREVAERLALVSEAERPLPPRVRIHARVAAALLPGLAGLAPPNVRLLQTAGRRDGRGSEVAEAVVDREPWPNWFRPSYRMRPVRMPFDLRLECDVTAIERERPLVLALLGPVTGLSAPVLVSEGSEVYRSRLRLTRIDAVSQERIWYPYGAGSFGAEMML